MKMKIKNELKTKSDDQLITNVILTGDLKNLTPEQKVSYYNGFCERLGLDPFTKPFDILNLNGKSVLYCTRSGTQQLNKLHAVSHSITSRETNDSIGIYSVICRASLPDGRHTESIGAVNVSGLKGDAYANALMKAETKAKRRATLDLLGLGVLDETEIETIPNAKITDFNNEIINKPKENEIIETKEKTISENIFNTKYQNIEDIIIVLDSVESLTEMKDLYFANQKLVDSNKDLKQNFINKKKNIK